MPSGRYTNEIDSLYGEVLDTTPAPVVPPTPSQSGNPLDLIRRVAGGESFLPEKPAPATGTPSPASAAPNNSLALIRRVAGGESFLPTQPATTGGQTFKGLDTLRSQPWFDAVDSEFRKAGISTFAWAHNAFRESGGNPNAVGDGGKSFGLFQFYEGGVLGDLIQRYGRKKALEIARNPVLSAREMARRARAAGIHQIPDERHQAVEFTRKVERPAKRIVQQVERELLGDQFTPGLTQPPSAFPTTPTNAYAALPFGMRQFQRGVRGKPLQGKTPTPSPTQVTPPAPLPFNAGDLRNAPDYHRAQQEQQRREQRVFGPHVYNPLTRKPQAETGDVKLRTPEYAPSFLEPGVPMRQDPQEITVNPGKLAQEVLGGRFRMEEAQEAKFRQFLLENADTRPDILPPSVGAGAQGKKNTAHINEVLGTGKAFDQYRAQAWKKFDAKMAERAGGKFQWPNEPEPRREDFPDNPAGSRAYAQAYGAWGRRRREAREAWQARYRDYQQRAPEIAREVAEELAADLAYPKVKAWIQKRTGKALTPLQGQAIRSALAWEAFRLPEKQEVEKQTFRDVATTVLVDRIFDLILPGSSTARKVVGAAGVGKRVGANVTRGALEGGTQQVATRMQVDPTATPEELGGEALGGFVGGGLIGGALGLGGEALGAVRGAQARQLVNRATTRPDLPAGAEILGARQAKRPQDLAGLQRHAEENGLGYAETVQPNGQRLGVLYRAPEAPRPARGTTPATAETALTPPDEVRDLLRRVGQGEEFIPKTGPLEPGERVLATAPNGKQEEFVIDRLSNTGKSAWVIDPATGKRRSGTIPVDRLERVPEARPTQPATAATAPATTAGPLRKGERVIGTRTDGETDEFIFDGVAGNGTHAHVIDPATGKRRGTLVPLSRLSRAPEPVPATAAAPTVPATAAAAASALDPDLLRLFRKEGDLRARIAGQAEPVPVVEIRPQTLLLRMPSGETVEVPHQAAELVGKAGEKAMPKPAGSSEEQRQTAATPSAPTGPAGTGARRVTVEVEGVSRTVELTPEQAAEWEAAGDAYQSALERARFNHGYGTARFDQANYDKSAKGAAMRYAAEKRRITGQLTGKERQAAEKQAAARTAGKRVTVDLGDGRTAEGTITRNPSFGQVRVRLDDGTESNYAANAVAVQPSSTPAAPTAPTTPTTAANAPTPRGDLQTALDEAEAQLKAEREARRQQRAQAPQESPQQPAGTPAAVPTQGSTQPAPTGSGKGRTTRISTGAQDLDVEYVAIEARDLRTSHTDSLTPNPDYPAELQPRDRSRQASREQIADLKARLKPELLGENPLAQDGAPVVGPDRIVESGNARTITLRQAYAEGGPAAARYRQWLQENAASFGLDPNQVAGMDQPVLVRMRRTPLDPGARVEFTRQANVSSVARSAASETAKADADLLDAGLLGLLNVPESGDLSAAGNRGFVREFVSRLPVAEQPMMRDAEGAVSQDGIRRLRNALFFRTFGDEKALARLAEATDDEARNLTNALLQTLPDLLRVREGVEGGYLHPVDLAGDLAQAANTLTRLRAKGETVAQRLAQQGLFGEDIDPLQARLLTLFDQHKRSARKLAAVLRTYADLAQKAGDPRTGTLFDDAEPPTKGELLEAAIRLQEEPGGTNATARATDAATEAPGAGGQDPAVTGAGVRGPETDGPETAGNAAPEVGAPDLRTRLESAEAAVRKELDDLRDSRQGGKLGSGFGALNDFAEEAPYWIKLGAIRMARGAVEFGTWSREMLAEIGDELRETGRNADELLREIWNASRQEYEQQWRSRYGDLPTVAELPAPRRTAATAQPGAPTPNPAGSSPASRPTTPRAETVPGLNLDRIQAPEDVRRYLIDQAKANAGAITERTRGTITREETEQAAREMGLTLQEVEKLQQGQALNAEETLALRNLMLDLAAKARKAQEAYDANPGDETLVAAVAAQSEFQTAQLAAAGARAEAGRALSQWRYAAKLLEEAGPPATVEEFFKPLRKPVDPNAPGYGQRNRLFTQDHAAAARARLNQRLGRLSSGVDPALVGDLLILAGYHVEAGIRDLPTLTRRLVEEYGPEVEPYMPEVWQRLQQEVRKRASRQRTLKDQARDKLFELLGGREATEAQLRAFAALPDDDPAALARYLRGLAITPPGKKLTYFWRSNVLSGPVTHLRNLSGNLGFAFVQFPERALRAGFDVPLSAIHKRPREYYAAEAWAAFTGYGAGFKTGAREGLEILRHGFSPEQAAKLEAVSGYELPGGLLTNAPMRFLAASDALFRVMAHTSELTALATRQAIREGKKGHRAVSRRAAEILQSPSEEMLAQAEEFGKYVTFTSDADGLARLGLRFRNLGTIPDNVPVVGGLSPLEFILPFVSTPHNILKRSFEYYPVGVLAGVAQGVTGNPKAAETLARGVIGSSILASVAFLAAEGRLTGALPQSEKERDEWERLGIPPYSLKIGDTWYGYQPAAPLALPFATVAAWRDAFRNGEGKPTEAKIEDFAGRIGKSLADQSFLRGMADLLHIAEDPGRYGGRLVESIGTGFVPAGGFFRNLTRGVDPYKREASGLVEKVQSGLPGAAQKLPAKVDTLGRPVERAGNIGWGAFSPFPFTAEKRDPVDVELRRLNVQLTRPDERLKIGNRTVPIPPEMLQRYREAVGREILAKSREIMADPEYRKETDEQRERRLMRQITRIQDSHRERIRTTLKTQMGITQ